MATSSVQVIPRLYLSNVNNDMGEEISEYVTGGSVSYDAGRLIPMALKLSFEHSDSQIIRPFLDYVAPCVTLRYDDGYEVTKQMGLFNTVPPSMTYSQSQRKADTLGYDMTWRLALDVFDTGYSVAAATNLATAIETICTSAGVTRTSITSTSYTATIAFSWKPGTTKIAVVNDLLAAMGYVPIYATKDGSLASHPYIAGNDTNISTTYDTTSNDNRVRIVRNVVLEPKFDKLVNKVTVLRQGPNQSTIAVTRSNNNPDSPSSITSLGMTIAKVINDSKVIDSASARLLAIKTLEEGSFVYERMKITTTPDVDRAPREAYHVKIVTNDGLTITDNKYLCTDWTLSLSPKGGLMTHSIARVDNGPQEDES